jgi:hypothetical protein
VKSSGPGNPKVNSASPSSNSLMAANWQAP